MSTLEDSDFLLAGEVPTEWLWREIFHCMGDQTKYLMILHILDM